MATASPGEATKPAGLYSVVDHFYIIVINKQIAIVYHVLLILYLAFPLTSLLTVILGCIAALARCGLLLPT